MYCSQYGNYPLSIELQFQIDRRLKICYMNYYQRADKDNIQIVLRFQIIPIVNFQLYSCFGLTAGWGLL